MTIVAHRVNTIREANEAIDRGVKWLEIDVHTRDNGDAVVCHDYDTTGLYAGAVMLDAYIAGLSAEVNLFVEIKTQSYVYATTRRVIDSMAGHKGKWYPISFSRTIAQSFGMPYGWVVEQPALIDRRAAFLFVAKERITERLPVVDVAKWVAYTCNTQQDVDRARCMGADFVETDDICLR